jgi:hypothetical protein
MKSMTPHGITGLERVKSLNRAPIKNTKQFKETVTVCCQNHMGYENAV